MERVNHANANVGVGGLGLVGPYWVSVETHGRVRRPIRPGRNHGARQLDRRGQEPRREFGDKETVYK